MQRGFSLVELSVVLVILGLLAGSLLTGQSLIRASELRSVVTEHQRYSSATQAFRDKYFAIPGDMANATDFWGKDNTNCSGHTGTAMTPGTCNGNGNGRMNSAASAGATGEIFQFWKQLALAGMAEGNYTGLSGPGSTAHAIGGTNVPRSKLTNASWFASNASNYGGDATWYAYDYGNYLSIGSEGGIGQPFGAALRPEEAWNIDNKIDDGKPGAGGVIAAYWNNACAAASANNDYAASYRVSDTTKQCILIITKAF